MSLYNDYTIQIFTADKVAGFQSEVANDRLVRIANGARRPWWQRILDGPTRPPQDRATDWYRYPQVRHHGLPTCDHRVVR